MLMNYKHIKNRRTVFQVCSAASLLWLLGGTLLADGRPLRCQITLDGVWHVKRLDSTDVDMASLSREAEKPGTEWFPATMPAQVQEVLLQRGDIPDPRQSRNCAETTWVFNHDWVYATRFVTPAAVNGGPVWLRCDGLDTLATLYLNGQEVGQAANMFRRHAFEVGKQMAPVGEDEHAINPFQFASPFS